MWFSTFVKLLLFIFYYLFGVHSFEVVRLKREGNSCTTVKGYNGNCIPIRECNKLLDLMLKNKDDPKVKEYLIKHHCGYSGKYPKVCCEEDVDYSNISFSHFPSECGKLEVSANDRRIAGRAPLNAWPWMALLGYKNKKDKSKITYLCLGGLITDRHVVTTAHCLILQQPVVVRLGESDLKSDTDGAQPIDVNIDKLITFPSFNKSKYVNDIGIIVLANTVTFSAGIKPICLPRLNNLWSKNFTDAKAYIAGWGATDLSNSKPTHQLLETTVLVQSEQICRTAYSNFTGVTIDERVVCAGGGKNDACRGDSGGPLMVEEDGAVYMIGIVAFGYKCGVVGYPSIYTNTSNFFKWIADNTI